MTPQSQIIEVAKLDGWTKGFEKEPFNPNSNIIHVRWKSSNGFLSRKLPSYLTYRDAIIEVIKKQNYTVKARIIRILLEKAEIEWDSYGVSDRVLLQELIPILEATAAQLTEALLRATGKWEE